MRSPILQNRCDVIMPEYSSARLPLYTKVEDVLTDRISCGALPIGAQLPSEEELTREFDVSRTAIRTTIQNLVRQGLLEIRRGRRTFVASPRMIQEMTELTGDVVPAGHFVADKFAITPGTPVVQIRCVRLSDGVPLSFADTHLPEGLGGNVMADTIWPQNPSSLCWTSDTTRLSSRLNMYLKAAAAEPAIAIALEIPAVSPIFQIDRTSYTLGHRRVDYERLHYRGDHIRFKTRRARRRPQHAPARG